MIPLKFIICLIYLASITVTGSEPNSLNKESIWQNNSDYTFMWWAYGLRDPSKVFHIQTSHYGLSFDFDDLKLHTFGPIANAAPEQNVIVQDNSLIEELDNAALQCVIEHDGLRFEASGAGPGWENCMLVESGKFFQRRWLEKLTFNRMGRSIPPPNKSSLEISAWPDRIAFIFHVKPDIPITNGALEIILWHDPK